MGFNALCNGYNRYDIKVSVAYTLKFPDSDPVTVSDSDPVISIMIIVMTRLGRVHKIKSNRILMVT